MGRQMATRVQKKNFLIAPPLLVGGIAMIFERQITEAYQDIWFIASLVLIVIGLYNSSTERRCGHGWITTGKWGFCWPYIIQTCPVCGDRFE